MDKVNNPIRHVLEQTTTSFLDLMKQYVGQPIYASMARYAYAGVVTQLCPEGLVLANAHVIEHGGAGTNSQPNKHEPIGSDLIIRFDATETISQPVWVFNGPWSKLD